MSDNPCECLFNHEAMMSWLLSLLRDLQTDCTDSDCMTSLPEVSGSGIGGNMMLIAILWGILAMVMFFFRPSSMRSDSSAQNQGQLEGKPLSSGGNNEDNNGPPAPDVH